jgi:hypothetical protein
VTTGLDGSVYVAGQTVSPTLEGLTNAGEADAFVTKFASDGTKVWTKLIGSAGSDWPQALITGSDGSIYVAGQTNSVTPNSPTPNSPTPSSAGLDGQPSGGMNDVFVTKLLPEGTKSWTRLIGSTSGEMLNDLITGLDGSVYVAGMTNSQTLDGQANAGNADAFVTKFAPDGSKAWTRLVGSTSMAMAQALTTGSDGSVYVAGQTDSPTLGGQNSSGGQDAFVTKFASNGTKVWTRKYLKV